MERNGLDVPERHEVEAREEEEAEASEQVRHVELDLALGLRHV